MLGELIDGDSNGHLLLSFDTGGTAGGVDFDKEDVLEFDGATWEMAYDGGAEHTEWPPACAVRSDYEKRYVRRE
ncbi:MAG: hypothetical protein HY699_21520 [Deltaproteobacteria bacterium]|nr:hypothetical protein [Deltaproteobacteria bacterium]